MVFLYWPIQPSACTWVGFIDLKTLQSVGAPLVTSLVTPTPIIHSPVTLSKSRPLWPKVNVCHPHSPRIMPCFMDGLILKHSLCMWALMCPSATLSHVLFLLKVSEIPVSDLTRILSFLSIPPPPPPPP